MRKVLFTGLSVVGLLAIAITSSPSFARARTGASTRAAAAAIPDRYCLQGRIWGYPGNCQFSTYEQCEATASGTDAYCAINPQRWYADQQRSYWRTY